MNPVIRFIDNQLDIEEYPAESNTINILFDDYTHHCVVTPRELEAILNHFPNAKLTVTFNKGVK